VNNSRKSIIFSQGEIVALNGKQEKSFKEAKDRVVQLSTKEKATEAMVNEKMREKVPALVNAVKKMGILVENEVDKPVDQLEKQMSDKFENFVGKPAAIKIDGKTTVNSWDFFMC
jgi:hypothetical protein